MCKDYSFKAEIIDLIDSGVEGEYWDFKKLYYDNAHKGDMLHDILCMANTQSEHDGFIIFGIEDRTGAVYGVENDPNRICTENVISFLRDKPFIAGIRPDVQIKTLKYKGHEIDVLVIKNTRNVPYFVSENVAGAKAGCIYTRVGDSNTPANKSADILHVEHLWKKRFGLLSSPLFRFRDMLFDREGWLATETDFDTYYYVNSPEFTLHYAECSDYRVQGNYFFADYWPFHKPKFQDMHLSYFGTVLSKVPIVIVDDGRYSFPVPNATTITFPEIEHTIRYYYYSQESIRYAALVYLEDNNYPDRQPLYNMIPIFRSTDERLAFEDYIKQHNYDYYVDIIKNWKNHFNPDTLYFDWLNIDERCAKSMNDELKWNTLMVNILDGFRLKSEFGKHD